MNKEKLSEIWNEAEELDCSLRELTDSELIECRCALLDRVKKIMADCDNLIEVNPK